MIVSCAHRSDLKTGDSSSNSPSPYIDQIRAELKDKDEKEAKEKNVKASGEPSSPSPYIDKIKAELNDKDKDKDTDKVKKDSGSYTASLKQKLDKEKKEGSFIAEVKSKMDPSEGTERKSAIADLKEGRSELKEKRSTDIHHLIGFTVAPFSFGSIGSSGAAFNSVYSTLYPDISLLYEYQPLHSETFGSLGVGGHLTLKYAQGFGQFSTPLTNARTGQAYSSQSQTRFAFVGAMITPMVSYRLNLLHYLRFHGAIGPSFIPYMEFRADTVAPPKDFSLGARFHGGAHLLLDWMSRAFTWSTYETSSIKHMYLTAEFDQTLHFWGQLKFQTSSVALGFSFEY